TSGAGLAAPRELRNSATLLRLTDKLIATAASYHAPSTLRGALIGLYRYASALPGRSQPRFARALAMSSARALHVRPLGFRPAPRRFPPCRNSSCCTGFRFDFADRITS